MQKNNSNYDNKITTILYNPPKPKDKSKNVQCIRNEDSNITR